MTGLSIGTVSRVLRQQAQVSPQTSQRVMDAAQKLKYRPNLLVRGMQTGKTRMIGVLVPMDQFHAQLFRGIHDELIAVDHVPLALFCGKNTEGQFSGSTELEQIHRMIDRRVDGVILRPVEDAASDEYLNEVWDRGLPLVAVDRELPQTHADFVGTDDELGGRMAAKYLLSLGHRRLGHIAGPAFASTGRLRRLGFESAVSATGAVCQTLEDPTFTDGQPLARELLRRPNRPTAIFASSDYQAKAIYAAAAELGLRIPQDISVMGYADLELASAMVPALTTLRQPAAEIGQRAARLLLDRINHRVPENQPIKLRLAPLLVERGSVIPADEGGHKPAKASDSQ